jgi:hypothetical protein
MSTRCLPPIEIGKKFFPAFDNIFHVYLMNGLQKMQNDGFLKIHFICFEMHMERPDKSENTFGI